MAFKLGGNLLLKLNNCNQKTDSPFPPKLYRAIYELPLFENVEHFKVLIQCPQNVDHALLQTFGKLRMVVADELPFSAHLVC